MMMMMVMRMMMMMMMTMMMMMIAFDVHPAKGSEGYAVTVVQGWAL